MSITYRVGLVVLRILKAIFMHLDAQPQSDLPLNTAFNVTEMTAEGLTATAQPNA